jgi:hypothetical protein
VSIQLDRILKEYEQLRSAYAETRAIRAELANFQNSVPEGETDLLEDTQDYFEILRKLLNTISEKLSRIQPKVQQLFSVFSRANFSAKTDRFIRHLLMNSRLVNNRVMLPKDILPFTYQIRSSVLKFLDPSRSPFPRPVQPRPVHHVDSQHREEAFWLAGATARKQDEAYEWLAVFMDDLAAQGDLMLGDYFFKVLQGDWSRFEVAIRFSYLVLQEYSNHTDWQLSIEAPHQSLSPHTQLQIWTMRVYRKNSISSPTQ